MNRNRAAIENGHLTTHEAVLMEENTELRARLEAMNALKSDGGWPSYGELALMFVEKEKQIAALTAERDELKAIFKEQEAIICGVGPITCRNGVVHERDDDSDCFYCQMDRIKTENERLRQIVVDCHAGWPDEVLQEALRGEEEE